MPARVNKIRHDDETRAKIRAGNIINRLQKLIAGEIEMAPHAVTAALGLLRKSLPDLTSVEHSGEITKNYVARMPAPVKGMDEWQSRYTPTSPTMTKQ
jgi:hypothetical protein